MSTFELTYSVTVSEEEDIEQKVEGICLEQSVELPRTVLDDEIETEVTGKAVSCKQEAEHTYEVVIQWPLDNIGGDISQFLNILYGNISLQPGIRLKGAEWEKLNGELFAGPAFGIQQLRGRLGIPKRALSSTALKPLGTDVGGMAKLACQFAAGGIDIIKDDHNLVNQKYAPFEKRVKACVESVKRAADETGHCSYYFPHITALGSEALRRYEQAAGLGADGVLICPHIAGLEIMHQMTRMDIPLPIIAHPAFSGSLTTNRTQGLAPDFLYGQLWRALGADFVIYPNAGGRFSFSLEECQAINESARTPDLPFASCFPMPAGGIKRANIPHWLETYGNDTVFLIGAGLYDHPQGPQAAAREFAAMLS